jgi:hypothetical protein
VSENDVENASRDASGHPAELPGALTETDTGKADGFHSRQADALVEVATAVPALEILAIIFQQH